MWLWIGLVFCEVDKISSTLIISAEKLQDLAKIAWSCKFLDWLFIETRACNKYLGIFIVALSKTRYVLKLQQSCWMTHMAMCHYWQQWTYLFLLSIADKLYYFILLISLFFYLLSGSGGFLFLVSRLYLENFILAIIWYSKVPVRPKWRCDTLCSSDFRQLWRLVCRNMMKGHKSTELTVLFAKELCVLPSGSSIYFLFSSKIKPHTPTTLFNIQVFSFWYQQTKKKCRKKWQQRQQSSSSVRHTEHRPAPLLLYCWQRLRESWLSLSCYVRNIHLVRLQSTRRKVAVTGEIKAAVPTEIKPTHSHTHMAAGSDIHSYLSSLPQYTVSLRLSLLYTRCIKAPVNQVLFFYGLGFSTVMKLNDPLFICNVREFSADT